MFSIFFSNETRAKRELVATLKRRLSTAMRVYGVNSDQAVRLSVQLDQALAA